MEPIPNEGGHDFSSLFSFSSWRKSVRDPKIRRVELVIIFGIGIFLGIVAKDIGGNTLTIGYQDYTVRTPKNRIDFNVLERETITKKRHSIETTETNTTGACLEEQLYRRE